MKATLDLVLLAMQVLTTVSVPQLVDVVPLRASFVVGEMS